MRRLTEAKEGSKKEFRDEGSSLGKEENKWSISGGSDLAVRVLKIDVLRHK